MDWFPRCFFEKTGKYRILVDIRANSNVIMCFGRMEQDEEYIYFTGIKNAFHTKRYVAIL